LADPAKSERDYEGCSAGMNDYPSPIPQQSVVSFAGDIGAWRHTNEIVG